MNLNTVTITSTRLLLMPLSQEYAEDMFREFTSEITKYMFPKSPENINETVEYIASQLPKIEAGEELPVVIVNKDTKEFVGCRGLHRISSRTPKLGIWIKKSAHGNKYGLETIKALKEWADQHLDYDYLIYPADKRNVPSRKIAERLGGKPTREFTQKNMAGNVLEEIEYRIYKK